MPISKVDVEKIAQLARLELTQEEADSFTQQLGSILDYVGKLNELDTSAIGPMSHCSADGGNSDYALRDDQTRPGLGQDVAVANAPDAEDGYFKVPKVIGG
jgi:aspartyl-tRNA(Asn)/glutamyl-tRNA(Gln) amidotransferase subunit C